MTEGVISELKELIALKNGTKKTHYKLAGRAAGAGNYLSRLRGRGMDFSEVRNYQAGDEIRHMEWRVTARTGRPHIKVYEEERERPVVLVVDFNSSMYFGTRRAFKSVIATRLAALIAWSAMKQGDRVGALLFSADDHHEFTPKAREAGVLPLLASLCHYTRQIPKNMAVQPTIVMSDELLRLRRVTKPGSVVILISDFYQMDNECLKHLSRLSAHNDVLAYHICDVLELTPPKPSIYALSNGQQAIMLDARNNALRNDYQSFCDERHVTLQSQLKRLQIQYTQVSVEDELAQVVRRTFPRSQRG